MKIEPSNKVPFNIFSTGNVIIWLVLYMFLASCNPEHLRSQWTDEDVLTIGQYLEKNREDYSKFYQLLGNGEMLSTLSAYNPYGNGYTLFLPTDDAIDQYLEQDTAYSSFEEMLQDSSFVHDFTRYHVLKRMVRTNEFPFGALVDSTLTGERLAMGFFEENGNHYIKVNNQAPIIRSNMEMVNGYIHIISGVLQQVKVSGYDWLQRQEEYSILARAMQLSGIRSRLWWSKYTLFAEHDSIYHKKGIYSAEDLIKSIGTPGLSVTNRANAFYKFVGYHIMGGEYYLNELPWGSRKYTTLDSNPLTIAVGMEIKINPGIDVFGIMVSEKGDTTYIDYIQPVYDNSNNNTLTGPVHGISEVMFYQVVPDLPFREE